jgi:hypothetical protein
LGPSHDPFACRSAEMVVEMTDWHGLDALTLKQAFVGSFSLRFEVEESPVDPFTFKLFVESKDISDILIRVSPDDFRKLADNLEPLISFYFGTDSDLSVGLLASIAIIVFQIPIYVDRPSTNPPRLRYILQQTRADFAIICVGLLARPFGYRIRSDLISEDEILWALLERKWEWVAEILRRSMGITQPKSAGLPIAINPTTPREFTDYHRRLINLEDAVFERSALTRKRAIELVGHPVMLKFASLEEASFLRRLLGPSFDVMIDMTLDRSNSMPRQGRKLSASSYSNLRSVAEMEGWSDVEIIRLVDEHLNPALSPRFVYYSSTISGDDWRRLYRRLKSIGRL